MTSVSSDQGGSPFDRYTEGSPSFKDESLFALQGRADLGDGFSSTVQLMAEGQNDFNMEAKWAYLSYELSDTHRLSAGRFANPIFYQSEYELVGFAHNYMRLPKAVYTGFPFSTVEGISLDSSYYIGDYTLATKVLYGNWNGDIFLSATNQDETLGLENIISLKAVLMGDGWTVSAGTFIAEMDGGSVDTNAVFGAAAPGIAGAQALGATTQEINAFKDAIKWDGKDGIYSFMGFNYDKNSFIVDFEYVNYGVKDSTDGFNSNWYLGLGYRVSDQMAVIVHTEEFTQDSEDTDFLNGVTNPVLNATGKAILEALAFREFSGSGIQVRYDFHPSAAFKIDYFVGEDTRPTVGDYQFFSLGIDLVF
jgi:hypothetical protein